MFRKAHRIHAFIYQHSSETRLILFVVVLFGSCPCISRFYFYTEDGPSGGICQA